MDRQPRWRGPSATGVVRTPVSCTAQVVGADPDADPPWLVTASIVGPSLQEAVGRQGLLPESMISVRGRPRSGLAAIHASGVPP